MNLVTINGMEEINLKLNQFEDNLARKTLKKSLTEVCRPIVRTIKENIRGKIKRRKGILLRSIGIWIFNKPNEVYVGPRTGKRSKYDAWYAHFLEFGTSSNKKRIRNWSSKLITLKSGFTVRKKIGTTVGYKGHGGGITARPFMRPSWDKHKGTIMEELRLNLKQKLGI